MHRWIVAAFVVWHAAAVLVTSIPTPGQGLNRKNWAEPSVQHEFATWAGYVGTESETLQDRVYALAVTLQAARDALIQPFAPYLRATNSRQSWKMFVAAHRYPTTLEIAVRAPSSPWEVVYAERDPDATWRRERFDTERMRASVFAWGWPTASRRWKSACRGFARDLYAERPDAEGVRCRFLKRRSPSAAELRAGAGDAGEWVLPVVIEREDLDP